MKALALTGLALLLLVWAGVSRAATPEEILRAGKASFEKGDAPAALASFKECLDAGAQGKLREEALNWVAESLWRIDKLDQAIEAYEVEISTGKDDTERTNALLRKAGAQMVKGDEDAGQATYAKLAREYPNGRFTSLALLFQANYAVLKKGDRRKAIALFEDLALRFPETEDGKYASEILPGLHQVSEAEFQRQVRENQQQHAAVKKAKAEAAKENGGTKAAP